MIVIPATTLLTVADLRDGDFAALFPDCGELQRIRYIDDCGRSYRVEWDHGPGTRARVRYMPGSNKVQARR